MKKARDSLLRNGRPTKQTTIPQKTERIELDALSNLRQQIFEGHVRMNGLIDKAKNTIDDLNYLLRYAEFCDSQAKVILQYLCHWIDKEEAIEKQKIRSED